MSHPGNYGDRVTWLCYNLNLLHFYDLYFAKPA